ncbi:12627_t:CDS:1, partial [Funneliformis mosseae]
NAIIIPTVVRQHNPAFRCLETVSWTILKHTCLRHASACCFP